MRGIIVLVIRRLYVHNFRCLENFELPIAGQSSLLLIGKNGSGKSTVGAALEVLQKIARGVNRVGDLVRYKDLSQGRAGVPMRFEIEVELASVSFRYSVAFESQGESHELRVLDEGLFVDGEAAYSREDALMHSASPADGREWAKFRVDWHLVALPILQERSRQDPLYVFKRWLGRMLVLRPVPGLISGESRETTLEPNIQVTDFGAWFTAILAQAPSAYAGIDRYLKQVLPDLKDIKNPVVGTDYRSLVVQFATDRGSLSVPFEDLSDGEKCFMICALVLAANDAYGPLLCFWDEPDNYLSIDEVGHFVMTLRKAFQSGGQFIATSHNSEAISTFSDENTLYLYRKSHLEPTIVRPVTELDVNGDLVSALARGDVEP